MMTETQMVKVVGSCETDKDQIIREIICIHSTQVDHLMGKDDTQQRGKIRVFK